MDFLAFPVPPVNSNAACASKPLWGEISGIGQVKCASGILVVPVTFQVIVSSGPTRPLHLRNRLVTVTDMLPMPGLMRHCDGRG